MANKVCKTCNGTGHTKATRPVVIFKPYKDEEGKQRRQHTTLKQGYGCLRCLGRGVHDG